VFKSLEMTSNNQYGLAANRENLLRPKTANVILSCRGRDEVPHFPFALEGLIGQRLGCKEEIDGVPLRTPGLEDKPTFDQLDDARLSVVSTMSDLLVARLWLRPDASEESDDPGMEITELPDTPVIVARYVLAIAGVNAENRVVDATYAYSVESTQKHGNRLRRSPVHRPRVTGALDREDPVRPLLTPAPKLSSLYPDNRDYRGPVPYGHQAHGAFSKDR
jgi:hypothetical protein